MNEQPKSSAREIFLDAIDLEESAQEPYIREQCGTDQSLLEKTLRLLKAHRETDSWPEPPETIGSGPPKLTFEPGAKIDNFVILEVLGASMGEVYRAENTHFHVPKPVAIKTLSIEHSRNKERVARFQREANVLARFDHRNIGAVIDFVPAGPAGLLVLEWVDGETLAARIKRSPIKLNETLNLLQQIVDALEHAHDTGVVHRDLKPANIMITKQDHVKVLDFGLARVFDVELAKQIDMSHEFDSGLTRSVADAPSGRILGTVPYMSPEQAAGAKDVDTGFDIWAFGCLVYEMLTRRPLFAGTSVAEILENVKKAEPDLSALPSNTPEALKRLLDHCLRKDRKRRLRHIADARLYLEEAGVIPKPIPKTMTRREAIAWMAAGTAAAAAAGTALWPQVRTSRKFTINAPNGLVLTGPATATISTPQFALSPDGKKIVFAVAEPRGTPMLYVRELDTTEARALPKTEGAEGPFWKRGENRDGEWIGFFADGKLKKIRADGNELVEVVPEGVSDPRGGSWVDDVFLYAAGRSEIWKKVSDGAPKPVWERSEGEGAHRWPFLLPDGKTFLYTVRSQKDGGIWVGSIDGRLPDGSPRKRLLPNIDSNVLYSPEGRRIIYLDEDHLKARPFNPANLKLGEESSIRTEGGVGRSTLGSGAISISTDSTNSVLAWSSPITQRGHLQWFSRKGQPAGQLNKDPEEYTDFRLSPNEDYVVATKANHKKGWIDIYYRRLTTRESPWTPLLETKSPNAINASPIWSRNGRHIVFRSNLNGPIELFRISVNPSSGQISANMDQIEQILDSKKLPKRLNSTSIALSDWGIPSATNSAEGQGDILFSIPADPNGYDLWRLPANATEAEEVLPGKNAQIHGAFSPNNRFIAYSSNDMRDERRHEVYVSPYPDLKPGRLKVSENTLQALGGSEPEWSVNGSELYYLSEGRDLMAAPIREGKPGEPELLFQTQAPQAINALRTNYAASRNGSFLINVVTPAVTPPSITVFTNWLDHLK